MEASEVHRLIPESLSMLETYQLGSVLSAAATLKKKKTETMIGSSVHCDCGGKAPITWGQGCRQSHLPPSKHSLSLWPGRMNWGTEQCITSNWACSRQSTYGNFDFRVVEFKGRKGNVIPALEQVRLPISGRGRWDWRIENHRNLSLSSSPDWQDYGQTGRNRITAHLGNCSGKPPARVLSSQRNTCISVPALQNHFLQASGSPSSG